MSALFIAMPVPVRPAEWLGNLECFFSSSDSHWQSLQSELHDQIVCHDITKFLLCLEIALQIYI